MKTFIFTNKPSSGARLLAKVNSWKLIKRVGSKFKPSKTSRVINWGSSACPYPCLNNPSEVGKNKLEVFTQMEMKGKEHLMVPYYTKYPTGTKKTIVARTQLNASCGKGIILIEPNSEAIPQASLYTEYVKNKKEFRVHIVHGKVIHVQEKRRRKGENPNSKIKNIDAGWVFCTKDIVEPTTLRSTALEVFEACGLDFGALDIIWNEHYDRCYVLEINTKPGLCETTAKLYGEAL